MNNLFNLSDFLLNNNLGDNSFNNLWYFDNLLNHSRNDNNLFNNFLHLDNFGYFDHFLNDFFNRHLDLLDSVNVLDDFNNLLFDVLDWLGNIDVVVDDFLDFDCFWLFYNNWISQIYFLNNCILDLLDHWLLDNFLNGDNSLMNDWNLNYPLYLFRNLFDDLDWDFNLSDDFLNTILNNNLFHNLLYLSNFLNDSLNSHNFFNNLWHFHNSFNSLDDWNWSLDNSINWFISNLNMVIDLLGSYNLNLWDYLFNNFFNLDNFRNLDNSVDNLFYNYWDLFDNFNYSFSWNNFFNDDLNLLNLCFDMVHNLFYFNNSFYFYLSFFDSVNNLNLWNLLNNFHNSFNNVRNLNYLLDCSFNWNDFLYNVRNDSRHFKWNIDNSLDFLYFLNFNYFLNNFLNWNDLRNLNDSVNNFLHDLLNFNNLGDNSEDFKNIIDINNTHDLLINHADNSFVDLESSTCFSFQFFKLFKQSFDQNSQMEFYSS